MRALALRHWPAGAALAALALILLLYAVLVLAQSADDFVYTLDDAYIHMAMAKNLAGHLVYGVSPAEFTSSSSSPAWVLLLAGIFAITGPWLYAPLALNLLAAIALIVVADRWLAGFDMPARGRAFALLALVAAAPLAPLVVTGMEHILHIVACLVLIALASEHLAAPPSARARIELVLLCAVLPMLRYESLFLIAGLAGLLALRGRWYEMAGACLAATASIGIYAVIADIHGWPPLPFSIFLKSGLHEADLKGTLSLGNILYTLGPGAAHRLLVAQPAWVALGALGVALVLVQSWRERNFWSAPAASLLMVLPMVWLHAAFVRGDDAGRYDAYVVSLLILAIAPIAWRSVHGWLVAGNRTMAAILVLCLSVPAGALSARAIKIVTFSLPWAQSIEQTTMLAARFAAYQHPHGKIVVMELGATAWSGDFRIVDMLGLGSLPVARLMWQRRYDRANALRLTEDFDLAIVFDDWFVTMFKAGPPPWRKIGRIVSENGLGGGIDLYAPDQANAVATRQALQDFAARNRFKGKLILPE